MTVPTNRQNSMVAYRGSLESQFTAAYEQYADAIFRHCLFRVYNRERARELTQETFCRVWQLMARGESIEYVRALLYRIATNLVIDESRKRKGESLEALVEEGRLEPPRNPESNAPTMDDLVLLEEFLVTLDDEDRELVRLRYLEGWNPRDIATEQHTTANVISVRLHRAMKKLKDYAAAYGSHT